MNFILITKYIIFLGERRDPIVSRRCAQFFTWFTILLFKANMYISFLVLLQLNWLVAGISPRGADSIPSHYVWNLWQINWQ